METLRRIKQMANDTEVIVITGSDGPECVQKAEGLGALDFLAKPLSLETVIEKVETVSGKIGLRHGQQRQGW